MRGDIKMNLYKTLALLLLCTYSLQYCIHNTTEVNTSAAKKTNDSIGLWINAAKNNSFHIQKRKEYLAKSYRVIQREQI